MVWEMFGGCGCRSHLYFSTERIALVVMVSAMGSPTLISNFTPNLQHNYLLRMQKPLFATLMTWPCHPGAVAKRYLAKNTGNCNSLCRSLTSL